jgi:hypothetical protein
MVYQECSTAGGWIDIEVPSNSDPEKIYTITFSPWKRQGGGVCECPGFLHRGHCSHLDIALKKICGWAEINEGCPPQTDHQRRNRICPGCGGSTKVVVE